VGSKKLYTRVKLGKTLPCPRCGSTDVESRGRVGVEGIWPDVMLIRRYRCRSCGLMYESAELVLDLIPPSSSGAP
jgi:transposase-like protein